LGLLIPNYQNKMTTPGLIDESDFNLLNRGDGGRNMPACYLLHSCPRILKLKYFHFLTSVITLIILSYTINEARMQLKDAAITLADVQQLVPEVRKSLAILNWVCEAPEWAPYCK
jgi:hypothetical protein